MVNRVGILTLSLNANFGGIIQAVALSHWLTSRGCEVTLMNRRRPISRAQAFALPILEHLPLQNIRGVRHRELSRKRHRPFIMKHFTRSSAILRSSADMVQAVRKHELDAVIVGSDQVWRIEYLNRSTVTDFFLGFGDDDAYRRISYAASFGVGSWNFPKRTAAISQLLSRFDAVSVREASGVDICRNVLGRADASLVLDPTLLVPAEFHASICAAPPEKHEKNVLCYVLDKPEIKTEVLAELGHDYVKKTLSLADSDGMTVPMWLASFRNADFVVTDSFHGMIFAIVFEKPFIAISNAKRGSDRFTSLLGLLGLPDRLIFDHTPERISELVATPIDFGAVRAKLAVLREESEAFLLGALD